MANIKISQLPTYSGTPSDIRWFVMNNEGETITFKFSGYTSPFKPASGSNSYLPHYSSASANVTSINSIFLNGNTTQGQILGGNGYNILGAVNNNGIITNAGESVHLGSGDSILSNSNQVALIASPGGNWSGGNFAGGVGNFGLNGSGNAIFAGGTRISTISGNQSGMIGTESSLIQNSNHSFIGGGTTNQIISGAGRSSIIAGESNTISNAINNSVIIGGQSNNVTSNSSVAIGGVGNSATGLWSIAAGYASVTVGEVSMSLGNQNRTEGKTDMSLGGTINRIYSTNEDAYKQNALLGGESNTITNSLRSAMIGSKDCSMNGLTHTILLGTTGLTATESNTTYVDNIHVQKTESFNVIAGGNVGGNIDVDCSLGTIYTFTMTANTTPNFINFRDGQRITFVVTNTTFSVPSATIDGGGSVYAKNGSISPSNNNKTLYYGTFISGDLYIDEHTGFDAA